MAASVQTVLEERLWPTFLLQQVQDVGAASRYALANGVNARICEGIAANINRHLQPHTDTGALFRVETGFNAATQFLGAIEDAATGTKVRFKNSIEESELEDMRNMKDGLLDMISRNLRDMDKHFIRSGFGDGGATYRKIRDTYLPVLTDSGVRIERHVAGERERVSREYNDQARSRQAGNPSLS
jgi:hypothetical protein